MQETLLAAEVGFRDFAGESEREFSAWLRRILIDQVAMPIRHHQGTAARDISRKQPIREGSRDDADRVDALVTLPNH